ncbi:MAG: hypothetical protein ABI480_19315, partial [Chitinophagaceae bacterium]
KLNVVYKETYPFSLMFRYNKASPFQMDDQYELDLGFDQRSFKQMMLEKTTAKIKSTFQQKQAMLMNRYEQVSAMYKNEKATIEGPAYAQHVIEDRLKKKATISPAGTDNVINEAGIPDVNGIPDKNEIIEKIKKTGKDSADSFTQQVKGNTHSDIQSRVDSLHQVLSGIQDSIASGKVKLSAELDSAGRSISETSDLSDLKKSADTDSISGPEKKDKLADMLMNTNIRLGKFLLSNSELTVNNIFLHGASIKYGNEKFIILSGGIYDFSFRQVFNFRNDKISMPATTVFAVKLGKTDGRNLSAVTLYTGKKIKRGSVNDQLETVAGLSFEKKIYFSRNFSLETEIAKSTTLRNNAAEKDPGTVKDLFGKFSTKTIGIYNSANAYFPKTSTDAQINYRYWGQQFQSFNASQYFNPQNDISGKLSQPFFKRKLYIATGAKYTDFKTYGISSNIHSKTIFASASATLRIRKLPIVSVGYYPGSQVYLLDQSKLYEYYYYIFNTTISYYFNARRMPMQIVLTQNKFFNKYTDSIVSGSQSYYNIYWTAWKNKFSYSVNLSRQETQFDMLNTVEAGLSYAARSIKIGGSLKWNTLGEAMRMGYSLNTGISFGKIGSINLIYDKGFLPSRAGEFIPVVIGQIQFIKPINFSVWQ